MLILGMLMGGYVDPGYEEFGIVDLGFVVVTGAPIDGDEEELFPGAKAGPEECVGYGNERVSGWIDEREKVVLNTNLMSDFGRREVENKFKEVYETV